MLLLFVGLFVLNLLFGIFLNEAIPAIKYTNFFAAGFIGFRLMTDITNKIGR